MQIRLKCCSFIFFSAAAAGLAMVRGSAFKGGEEALAKVLLPHASSPDFIKYGEKMLKSPVMSGAVIKMRHLLRDLLRLHDDLQFKPDTLQNALRLLAGWQSADDGQWPRALTDAELKDYAEHMCARIRTMCAHVVRTRSKHPETAWLCKVFTEPQPATEVPSALAMKRPAAAQAPAPAIHPAVAAPARASAIRRPASASMPDVWFPGYCFEASMAFLADASGRRVHWAPIEFAAKDEDPPNAHFEIAAGNFKRYEIESVTTVECKAALQSRSGQATAALWSGARDKVPHRIIRRSDAKTLLIKHYFKVRIIKLKIDIYFITKFY